MLLALAGASGTFAQTVTVCDITDPRLAAVIADARSAETIALRIDIYSSRDGSVEINLARAARLADQLHEHLRRHGLSRGRVYTRIHAELTGKETPEQPLENPGDCPGSRAKIALIHPR